MDVIETILEMQKKSHAFRMAGQHIAFVPTMGFLHEGHLELIRHGKRHADKLVVSIFVNPTQFSPNEDLESYPRDLEGDLSKAKDVGIDILFIPAAEEMYPKGYQTKIMVEKVTRYLCGISRPGHFDGVATVVLKLFNIIKPHMAIFGQKDYQQLTVIRRMVMDLNMDISIIGIPTIREPDGLAMSSRNTYLKPKERQSALCLKKSLDLANKIVKEGERDIQRIKEAIKELIYGHPYTTIDYINLCDPISLEDMETIDGEILLALAIKVGETRLIDNCLIKV